MYNKTMVFALLLLCPPLFAAQEPSPPGAEAAGDSVSAEVQAEDATTTGVSPAVKEEPDQALVKAFSILAALQAQPDRPIEGILHEQGLAAGEPTSRLEAFNMDTGELVVSLPEGEGQRVMVLSDGILAVDLTVTANDILLDRLDETLTYDMAVRYEQMHGDSPVEPDVNATEQPGYPQTNQNSQARNLSAPSVTCVTPNGHTVVCSFVRDDGKVRVMIFMCCKGDSCSGGSNCEWRLVLDTGWAITSSFSVRD